jgi:hypothetical protein
MRHVPALVGTMIKALLALEQAIKAPVNPQAAGQPPVPGWTT